MNACSLFRVILPVGDIDRAAAFYASDPFGNPLCFVSRDSVFRG